MGDLPGRIAIDWFWDKRIDQGRSYANILPVYLILEESNPSSLCSWIRLVEPEYFPNRFFTFSEHPVDILYTDRTTLLWSEL